MQKSYNKILIARFKRKLRKKSELNVNKWNVNSKATEASFTGVVANIVILIVIIFIVIIIGVNGA